MQLYSSPGLWSRTTGLPSIRNGARCWWPRKALSFGRWTCNLRRETIGSLVVPLDRVSVCLQRDPWRCPRRTQPPPGRGVMEGPVGPPHGLSLSAVRAAVRDDVAGHPRAPVLPEAAAPVGPRGRRHSGAPTPVRDTEGGGGLSWCVVFSRFPRMGGAPNGVCLRLYACECVRVDRCLFRCERMGGRVCVLRDPATAATMPAASTASAGVVARLSLQSAGLSMVSAHRMVVVWGWPPFSQGCFFLASLIIIQLSRQGRAANGYHNPNPDAQSTRQSRHHTITEFRTHVCDCRIGRSVAMRAPPSPTGMAAFNDAAYHTFQEYVAGGRGPRASKLSSTVPIPPPLRLWSLTHFVCPNTDPLPTGSSARAPSTVWKRPRVAEGCGRAEASTTDQRGSVVHYVVTESGPLAIYRCAPQEPLSLPDVRPALRPRSPGGVLAPQPAPLHGAV